MSTQPESTSLNGSSVRQDTSAQQQPSPALSTSSSARFNALSKRRTKKIIFTGSSKFMERAGRLGTDERRILKDYAGDTIKTRTLVLEKMESYRRQSNNQPPILELDSQASSNGSTKSWKCMICRESKMFPTFQRVALHITSTHWHLHSWPCPVSPCTRSYQALDQLRRHMKAHPREESTLTRSTILPASAPSPRPRPIAVDESQVQPRAFTDPPDGNTQAATSSGSSHGWNGSISTNNQRVSFEQPPREFLSRMQLQASVFDPPPPLPFPFMNEFKFLGNFLPNLDHANVPSTSISMNALPLNADNAGQQVQITGYMQHGQTNMSEFPTNQDFRQSNMPQSDLATHWYENPSSRHARSSLSPVTNASSFSMNQYHSMMNQGRVEAPCYLDYPTFSQPRPSASSASNDFHQPTSDSTPSNYSMSYSTPENEVCRQMSREYPSLGRLDRQDFIDPSEKLAPDTFWSSDQGPWWP